MNNLPHIENPYQVREVDPDTFWYPELEVKSSNGIVQISSASDDDHSEIRFESHVKDEYSNTEKSMQGIISTAKASVKAFNNNLEKNWDRELKRCFTELADEFKDEIETLERIKAKHDEWMANIEKLETNQS